MLDETAWQARFYSRSASGPPLHGGRCELLHFWPTQPPCGQLVGLGPMANITKLAQTSSLSLSGMLRFSGPAPFNSQKLRLTAILNCSCLYGFPEFGCHLGFHCPSSRRDQKCMFASAGHQLESRHGGNSGNHLQTKPRDFIFIVLNTWCEARRH